MKRNTSDKTTSDTISFVASTENSDRYDDIINQKGWQLSNYEKNPVVLLNHNNSQLPIGKGKVKVVNNELVIDVTFDMEDPIASEVARKSRQGFMNAVSVGFKPIKSLSRYDLPKDSPFYATKGTYFERAELLEVSIVTIPANGEATMITQKQLNLIKNELSSEIRQIIRGEILSLPELQLKHLISVKEEGDKVIIEFQKNKKEEENEEEIEVESDDKADSEESTEDMEEEELAYDEEEDEEDKEEKYLQDLAYYISSII